MHTEGFEKLGAPWDTSGVQVSKTGYRGLQHLKKGGTAVPWKSWGEGGTITF